MKRISWPQQMDSQMLMIDQNKKTDVEQEIQLRTVIERAILSYSPTYQLSPWDGSFFWVCYRQT